jgi:hypothetical protein
MVRKASPLEDKLDRIAELRRQGDSPEARAELARLLKDKMNLVAGKAARLAGDWQSADMAPELAAAFERFLVKPETTDKRCAAKIEILRALCKLEYSSPSIFLRGIRHVQMEPEWGRLADTAAEVRALSATGLAQTDYADVLEEVLPLLLDRERDARIGAVRAIAASGLPGDVLLLRLKALTGDEPEVLGECFAALLRAATAKSIDFVAQFLERENEAVAESAALALGDSRLQAAFDILKMAFAGARTRGLRRTLLVAIALLRREAAIDFLLDIVKSAEGETSAAAAEVLEMYMDDSKVRERLAQARQAR